MSKLIDADKLILHLNDYALQEAPFGYNDSKCQKEIYETIQECMKAVEEHPTAFDVEKVVEQLESLKEKGACYDVQCKHCNYSRRCWDGEYADSIALDKAIDIVKRGGKHEE